MSLIISTFQIPYVSKLYKKGGQTGDFSEYDNKTHEIASKWSLQRIKDSGSKVRVYGEENLPKGKNVIFVSNHQSNLDIPVIISQIHIPIGFVAKIELSKVPLLAYWMRAIRCIFINRTDAKQALKSLTEGISLIKKGYSLVIFPEGTRSKSSKIGEFKTGALKIATKTKSIIVPLTIDGTYRIMEGNKNNRIIPSEVSLYIHKPIDTSTMSKNELSDLPYTLKDIISSKL